MTRTFAALATAAVLAIGSTAVTTNSAQAGCGLGCGVAIGVGTAALIGAASHSHAYHGGYYAAGPGYYGPACHWRRERFFDGYGWRVRSVRVCY
jgi:hypothetical protein